MKKYILYIAVIAGLVYLANYTGIVEIPFLGKPYKPKESKPAPIAPIEPGEKAIPDHRMIEPEKKETPSSKEGSVTPKKNEDIPEVVYVRNNQNAHVISGQVMIRVSDLSRDSAYIEIMLPNMKVYRLDMQIGDRARFESNQKVYFLDLVEIYNKSAKIRITKRA